LRTQNTAEAAGAGYGGYRAWALALGYAIDNDTAVGNAAVVAVDATVAAQEAAIEAYVAGDTNAMQASFGLIAYDRWLYAEGILSDVALTYDLCYDLLTPTQRTRWYNFAMQATYNLFNPTDGVWHGTSASSNWTGYTWGVEPPFVTSNYHHHFIAALTAVSLAFEGETAINLAMQGGSVALNGDYFANELTTVQLPAMASQFDKMTGGGSMEGTNYGLALSDLLWAKSLWEWSKGANVFAPINAFLQDTARWRLHAILPNRTNEFNIGAHPNNENASVRPFMRDFHNKSIAAFPALDVASEIKLLTTEIIDLAPSTGWYHLNVFGFLDQPAIDSVTQAANYSAVSLVHSAPGAGDNFARTSWNADGVLLHVRSGEIHNGSHSHADATAFQLYKNGPLFAYGQNNWNSLDYDFWSTQANALDRQDKALCSIVGVGSMYESWPNGNNISEELTGKHPTVHYCNDYTGTDGSLHISVDAAPTYTPSNPTMQKFQRDFELLVEGVLLIFDRIETSSTESLTVQFNSVYDPAISGNQFTVNNGTSSAVVTPLNYSPTWTKVERSTAVRIGDGLWQTRGAAGSGTATSLVTAINIDGAASSIVLGSGAAGEIVVVVTLADTTVKTYTFYESQQLRSVS